MKYGTPIGCCKSCDFPVLHYCRHNIVMLKFVYELQISGVGSNNSTNWATTSALVFTYISLFWFWTELPSFTFPTQSSCPGRIRTWDRKLSLLNLLPLSHFFKKWDTPVSFSFIFVFSNKHCNFYNKLLRKMSIQYLVPGFEPTTFQNMSRLQ